KAELSAINGMLSLQLVRSQHFICASTSKGKRKRKHKNTTMSKSHISEKKQHVVWKHISKCEASRMTRPLYFIMSSPGSTGLQQIEGSQLARHKGSWCRKFLRLLFPQASERDFAKLYRETPSPI